jgi:hypothetical protein
MGKGCGVRLSWLGAAALVLVAPPVLAQATVATGVGTPFELAFWQSIDSSSDVALYEAYLTRFPNGTFVEIARARIATFRARQAAAAPVPQTPPAVSPALTVPVAAPAPAPAPAASPVSPPPPAPPPAAFRVPVSAPAPEVAAPAPAPAPAPVSSPAPGTMGQLLAALADSQATATPSTAQPAAVAPRAPTPAVLLPTPPALAPVAEVTLPPSFCSAEARNAFHTTVYTPSVNQARANNEAAAGYMRQLQALYDQRQLSHDPETMNAIVTAARSYSQVAQTTFSTQAALVRQFATLMALPVVPCAQTAMAPTQPLVP